MKGPEHDEADVFRAIASSGARSLLIGRRALLLLGAPVVTGDYDIWIHIDDIETLNGALEAIGLYANKTPDEARATGRYIFENDIRVDVLVARFQSTPDGVKLSFDEAWSRRRTLQLEDAGSSVHLPSIDDLILTKRWASRAKDLLDIQWLELTKRSSHDG